MAAGDPSTTVRAALVQAEWTGDKDSMIERHVAYAAQWWGLGLLALILFVLMNLRKRPT